MYRGEMFVLFFQIISTLLQWLCHYRVWLISLLAFELFSMHKHGISDSSPSMRNRIPECETPGYWREVGGVLWRAFFNSHMTKCSEFPVTSLIKWPLKIFPIICCFWIILGIQWPALKKLAWVRYNNVKCLIIGLDSKNMKSIITP